MWKEAKYLLSYPPHFSRYLIVFNEFSNFVESFILNLYKGNKRRSCSFNIFHLFNDSVPTKELMIKLDERSDHRA